MKFSNAVVAVYCTIATIATIDNVSAWVVTINKNNNNNILRTPLLSSQPLLSSSLLTDDDSSRKQLPILLHRKRVSTNILKGKLDDNDDVEDEDDDDDDDDDDYEYAIDASSPLAKGIDSVSWLPTVVGSSSSKKNYVDDDDSTVLQTKTQEDNTEILPLFPLGGIVYIPNSEHILNIFEPRYRQMYSDILLNGTKRFAVSMSHPTEAGRFATMAVLFELQDLKEVSEQTGDRIKYICNHKVTGRVKLHRVINPHAWESRDTYLRVEGTLIDDSGKKNKNSNSNSNIKRGEKEEEKQQESTTMTTTEQQQQEPKKDEEISTNKFEAMKLAFTNAFTRKDDDNTKSSTKSSTSDDDNNNSKSTTNDDFYNNESNLVEEQLLRTKFAELVEIQHELEEDVRFTRASVISLSVKPGSNDNGLWQTIKLWQSFADQRLMARQNELQRDFQTKLQEFLKTDKGIKDDELPRYVFVMYSLKMFVGKLN
jgi:hypothetical protein